MERGVRLQNQPQGASPMALTLQKGTTIDRIGMKFAQ
jgi:hypothetical protein